MKNFVQYRGNAQETVDLDPQILPKPYPKHCLQASTAAFPPLCETVTHVN